MGHRVGHRAVRFTAGNRGCPDPACKNARCPDDRSRLRLSDSGGLYLEVLPSGARHWRWKYRFAGKKKRLALGSYPAVSLKQARSDRDAARLQLQGGTDPPRPAAAAAAAAAAAGALGAPAIATAPVAGARRYGGPVSADSLYRVNEAGRPEMFTPANGNQYILPTASGSVTPAGQVGGGAQAPTIIIQNTGTAQRVVSSEFDRRENILRMVTADLVDQIDNNSGPVYSALRRSTNVQGRL